MEREGPKVMKRLEDNLTILEKRLGKGVSYDLVVRRFKVAGRNAALIYLDGLIKDTVLLWVMSDLMKAEREDIYPGPLEKVYQQVITYGEVERVKGLDAVIEQVLSGPSVLLIDGEEEALAIDSRTYPQREPDEPHTEKAIRGPRDGFIETLVANTALIRRRLRDPSLRLELVPVGARSKTDVVVAHLADVASDGLVEEIKSRLRGIRVDGVPMGAKAIEEFIAPKPWYNPFPTVRFTQRPDVAAQHLMDGHVLVLVDTSPNAIILPATLFSHMQSAEDFYEPVLPATYLRWVLYFSTIVSLLLPPLWFAVASAHFPGLGWLGAKATPHVPLWLQLFLAEFSLDMIRLALIHSPNSLGNSLGFIGTILMGDMAAKVGLFSMEAILYEAVAAIGTFASSSIEFALAIRLGRLLLLALATVGVWINPLGGLVGIGIGLLFLLGMLVRTRSFGVAYLWPLWPLDLRALLDGLVRTAAPAQNRRPAMVNPQDPDRQPNKV